MNATMFLVNSRVARRWLFGAAFVVNLLLVAPHAHAAFHLWSIHELYTNNSGTLQFIELSTSSGGQNFVGGQQIQITSGGQTHTFMIPNNLSTSADTTNKTFLIGTAGLHAAGGPSPDFIMPAGFLFAGGGTINFFGANSGPYTALPTDGTLARNFSGGNIVNNPQNFSGQLGQVVVPEPAAMALLAVGAASCLIYVALRSRTKSPKHTRIS